MGIRVLIDMADEGDGEWGDGDIYNPIEDGDTYDSGTSSMRTRCKVTGCVWFL